MEHILELKGVTKDFPVLSSPIAALRQGLGKGSSLRVLEDVSCALLNGRRLAILGRNGAGKTTLLKIISTLIIPDRGIVKAGGFVLGKDDSRIRSIVGLAGESDRSFYWRLSGRQNLEFFAALYGLNGVERREKIERLLRAFDIDYADKRFDTYSSGMKKNFALMRALLNDPRLLLLDEPTKSLDPSAIQRLERYLRDNFSRDGNRGVVLATPSAQEAARLGDVFLIIHKGRVLAGGELEDIRRTARCLPQATLEDAFLKLTA